MYLLRFIAAFAIIFPLIGFFIDLKSMGEFNDSFLSKTAVFLFKLPWWGKILSIISGIIFFRKTLNR